MEARGFYLIRDEFFLKMSDPYLKINKGGKRPHYYCFKDSACEVFWMIPCSSHIEKYKRIMEKQIKKLNRCDIIHIVKLDNDKESAFLIQDMFR